MARERHDTDNIWVRLGIIVGATLFISFCVATTHRQGAASSAERKLEREARYACETAVEQNIAYPETVSYKNSHTSDINVDERSAQLLLELTSENQYGVPSRFIASCVYRDGRVRNASLSRS